MKLCDYSLDNLPSTKVSPDKPEQQLLMQQLPEWQIINKDNVDQLYCQFKCENFVSAMQLASEITHIAEQADHHPTLIIEWGKVSVYWWSHWLKGLHINDFILAFNSQEIADRL
ncbi:MAG: 4a-hydroxytetrahydrobiopterin dehydratase [Porticoccaceae bacterium]